METEAAFQSAVVDLAKAQGWRVYHTHDSRRSAKGFPDLVLVRGKMLLFLELKTNTGQATPEQADWIQALKRVHHTRTGIARPRDWESLERMLA